MESITVQEMYEILDASDDAFKNRIHDLLCNAQDKSLTTYQYRCKLACAAYVFGNDDDKFKLLLASRLKGVCDISDRYRELLRDWSSCYTKAVSRFIPNRLEQCFNSLDDVYKPTDIDPNEQLPYTQGFLRWCKRVLGDDDIVTILVSSVIKRALRNGV